MTKEKKPDQAQGIGPEDFGGGIQAVPPPDDPMRRNEGEEGDIGSAEAALLRAEAIRQTRLMPSGDDPAPPKKQR